MSDVDYEPGGMYFDSDRNCHDLAPDRRAGQYTSFVDLNGRTVTVRYSSLATSAAVRIFAGLTADEEEALDEAGLSPVRFTGSAHLCRAMAVEVRDALDAFLDEPVEEALACETRTPRAVIVDDEPGDEPDDDTVADEHAVPRIPRPRQALDGGDLRPPGPQLTPGTPPLPH